MKKYRISAISILMMSAFILIDGTFFSLYAALSATAHELAHILTLRFMGGNVRTLSTRAFGAKLSTSLIGYRAEAVTALAGPIASLFLFILFFVLYKISPCRELIFLCASNLAIFILNILPVYPLDGGRALYCILSLYTGRAEAVTKIISVIFLLPVWIVSVIMLICTGYNLTLFLISVYLSVCLLGVKDI